MQEEEQSQPVGVGPRRPEKHPLSDLHKTRGGIPWLTRLELDSRWLLWMEKDRDLSKRQRSKHFARMIKLARRSYARWGNSTVMFGTRKADSGTQ